MFDTEKRDFLEVDEIKSIVTSYADVFDEAETTEMLRDANVRGDGNVFYEKFVESLFSMAPELYDLKVVLIIICNSFRINKNYRKTQIFSTYLYVGRYLSKPTEIIKLLSRKIIKITIYCRRIICLKTQMKILQYPQSLSLKNQN